MSSRALSTVFTVCDFGNTSSSNFYVASPLPSLATVTRLMESKSRHIPQFLIPCSHGLPVSVLVVSMAQAELSLDIWWTSTHSRLCLDGWPLLLWSMHASSTGQHGPVSSTSCVSWSTMHTWEEYLPSSLLQSKMCLVSSRDPKSMCGCYWGPHWHLFSIYSQLNTCFKWLSSSLSSILEQASSL